VKRWRWVGLDLLYAVHDRQLAEHGGLGGVRDQAAVESALAAPKQLAAYGRADAAALAAAYVYAVARNHGFTDGNKRAAWVAARVFLADNGYTIAFEPAEAVGMVEAVAAGTRPQEKVASWFRERIQRRKPRIATRRRSKRARKRS